MFSRDDANAPILSGNLPECPVKSLQITHTHPAPEFTCTDELSAFEVQETGAISDLGSKHPCVVAAGAWRLLDLVIIPEQVQHRVLGHSQSKLVAQQRNRRFLLRWGHGP